MKPPASGRAELFDNLVTGLCFRCTDKGAKSWSLLYRFNGDLRRDTIGKYPEISLSQARQKARDSLGLVADGKDPRSIVAAVEAAQAERKRVQRENNVAAVVEEFIKRKVSQLRSPETGRLLRQEIVPLWGNRPLADIRKRDVISLLDGVVDRGAPVAANRTLSAVKQLFLWAVDRDLIEASPAATVKKPTKEEPRGRNLTDEEIRALWAVCDLIGWPFGRIIQLLMLTGQRRGEIGDLAWKEIDRDNRVILIPASRYKTGIDHALPLSDWAVSIIDALPKVGDSPFVFTVTGRKPVIGHDYAKRRIDLLMPAGTPHWTVHDVRRTVRTKLSRLTDPDTAERVLGHVLPGERKTYDCHDYLPEKRAALDRWAAALDRIISPPAQGAKVVRMRRK
jgi:integrase